MVQRAPFLILHSVQSQNGVSYSATHRNQSNLLEHLLLEKRDKENKLSYRCFVKKHKHYSQNSAFSKDGKISGKQELLDE